jgi:hypothetical protein
MEGRAHQLFRDFQIQAVHSSGPFGVSRVILIARVVPESLTPDLDDPDLELRIEKAIERVRGSAPRRSN